jgi:putative phage terminase, small subunit, P27 family
LKGDLNQSKLPKKAPEYLGSIGKAMWRYLVPYLNENGKTIRADQYLVAQYCSAYEVYRKANAIIIKDGIQRPKYKTLLSPVDGSIVAKDFTGYAKNPAVMTMSNALNQLNSMGKELGLSPVSRKKLNEIQPEDSNSKSAAEKMKEFFG